MQTCSQIPKAVLSQPCEPSLHACRVGDWDGEVLGTLVGPAVGATVCWLQSPGEVSRSAWISAIVVLPPVMQSAVSESQPQNGMFGQSREHLASKHGSFVGAVVGAFVVGGLVGGRVVGGLVGGRVGGVVVGGVVGGRVGGLVGGGVGGRVVGGLVGGGVGGRVVGGLVGGLVGGDVGGVGATVGARDEHSLVKVRSCHALCVSDHSAPTKSPSSPSFRKN
jgi:hypothetical protein